MDEGLGAAQLQHEQNLRMECVKVASQGREGHIPESLVTAAEIIWTFVKGETSTQGTQNHE